MFAGWLLTFDIKSPEHFRDLNACLNHIQQIKVDVGKFKTSLHKRIKINISTRSSWVGFFLPVLWPPAY